MLVDHVDLGIVGDGPQGDIRRALVDKALADVSLGTGKALSLPGYILLFTPALRTLGQKVLRIPLAIQAVVTGWRRVRRIEDWLFEKRLNHAAPEPR